MRVLFLYNRPRRALHEARLRGEAPDELLYCLETVRRMGVDARFTDEGFRRRLAAPLYHAVENLVSARGKRVGFNLAQALSLRRQLSDCDLIFATADSNALPVLLLKSLGEVRTPVVYGTIGLAEAFRGRARGAVFRFFRRLLPHADRILYYGHGEGPILRDAFGIPEERLRFVRLGTDLEFFRGARGLPVQDYILTFGVDRRRDWMTFLRASKGLGLRFKMVTDPLLLNGMTWQSNVEVHPLQGVMEMRALIARARLVVLPVVENCYTAATFSLLQSMALGKAVIVSRTAAIAGGYELAFGEELIGVPPGDPIQLRLWIKALVADPARTAAMGERALRRAEESYSIESFAGQIVDVFREVVR